MYVNAGLMLMLCQKLEIQNFSITLLVLKVSSSYLAHMIRIISSLQFKNLVAMATIFPTFPWLPSNQNDHLYKVQKCHDPAIAT